ncbi:MAG TPA: hypothetical protein VG649_19380 [Candidatus Angelobacter sp.]|jgi:hypothetical protein|nr:hypothetical protein [Candidatus Angelobacter sp.]
MTLATLSLSEIAAFWRSARRLYTIYAELDRTFEIGVPLCRDLEYPVDRSEPEVIERVRQWFDEMDGHVQVWQLRQLLQSTNLQTEENLRDLIHRYMAKTQRTEIDRDKIDFLLVQYFAHCAPHGPYERQITLEEVARVLTPVLGGIPANFPAWSSELDTRLEQLNQCQSLEHLQDSGALVEARELKLEAGKEYFEPTCLIAFTRFNFLARRAFFRAMHLDLHAIRNSINQLEQLGISAVNCTPAGLSGRESLEQIRHLVHQWKTPFRAPYSGGSSFLQLIQLRHLLEQTLDQIHRDAELKKEEEAKAVQSSAQTVEEPVAAPLSEAATEIQEEAAQAPQQVPENHSPDPTADDSPQEFTVDPAEPEREEAPKTAQVIPIDIQKQKETQQAVAEKAVAAKAAASEPTALPEQPPKNEPDLRADSSQSVVDRYAAETDLQERDYLEQCVSDIAQQLRATPAKKSPGVRPIVLAGCKLLIATWEAEAFTETPNELSAALQRAVAARTILHVCIERHKKHEPTDIGAAMEIANRAVDEMREHVAKAKESRNIDAAVNLAATTKRLLSLIEEGVRLRQ